VDVGRRSPTVIRPQVRDGHSEVEHLDRCEETDTDDQQTGKRRHDGQVSRDDVRPRAGANETGVPRRAQVRGR